MGLLSKTHTGKRKMLPMTRFILKVITIIVIVILSKYYDCDYDGKHSL